MPLGIVPAEKAPRATPLASAKRGPVVGDHWGLNIVARADCRGTRWHVVGVSYETMLGLWTGRAQS